MEFCSSNPTYVLRDFQLDQFTEHQLMPVHSEVFTYFLKEAGEISTHRLDLLATSTVVLIVGTDLTGLFYPRKSLTNSIEHFAMAVLKRFPWIDSIDWDVAQIDSQGKCRGVSFKQFVDENGGIVLAQPRWEIIDGKRIRDAIGLGMPHDSRLIGR